MDGFGTALVLIAAVAAVVAALSYIGSGGVYRGLGRGGTLGLDGEEDTPDDRTTARLPTSDSDAREELRQLLEAKSARRQARGRAPLDVEAELRSLDAAPPAIARDPALVAEVRQLVLARNERRARQGRPALDIEAEVERQLRSLGA